MKYFYAIPDIEKLMKNRQDGGLLKLKLIDVGPPQHCQLYKYTNFTFCLFNGFLKLVN